MKKSNLCLHAGAHRVSLEELKQAAMPAPTKTHQPIPHSDLLQIVESEMAKTSLVITNQEHAMTPDGSRYFGLLEVNSTMSDYNTVIGLRNSNDKSITAGLAIGNLVFVCDNLSFTGDILIGRKHTSMIEAHLPQLVADALGEAANVMKSQDERVVAYKNTVIPQGSQYDEMLGRIGREGVLSWSKVGAAHREYFEPSYREHREMGFNLWRFQQAVTEQFKHVGVAAVPKRAAKMNRILDSYCREIDVKKAA